VKSQILTFALLAVSLQARAQDIQVQPTEIIRASPLTPFTNRVGTWPTYNSSGELTQTETEPVERYLSTLPGVQARAVGSPTISIRGSAQAGRTLSLFDGVPLFLADGFGAPKILLPQEILGDVRLMKGPASVFYGPAALGGAVNFIPRIYEDPAVRVSFNDQDGGIASRNFLGVIPFYLNRDKQDYVQISGFTEFDPGDFPYQSSTTPITGRRTNNDTHTNRMTTLGQQTFNGWLVHERIVAASASGTYPGDVTNTVPPTTYKSRDLLASADASAKLNDDLDFSLQLSHILDRDDFSGAVTTASRDLINTDFTQNLKSGLVIRTFVDAAHDKLKSPTFSKELSLTDKLELGQIWEIPLGNGFAVQPGARWLQFYDKFVSAIALSHTKDDQRVWFTYSEGFREPSLYDLYADTTFSAPNPDLEPEQAKQIELGYTQEPDKKTSTYTQGFTWGISLYGIDYSNFFENQTVSAGKTKKVDQDKAFAYGGELSAGVARGTRTLMLCYNHLQGEIETTNEPLTLAPRHQLTVAATQALGPAIIELRNTYTSSFYDRVYAGPLQKMRDANILDLNLRSIGFMSWEFKGGVLNIFDRPRELTIGYPEPQRTFYFSALRYL
jgi:outer membrane cobalamin receptor